jgi:hypothetical protein
MYTTEIKCLLNTDISQSINNEVDYFTKVRWHPAETMHVTCAVKKISCVIVM